MQLEQLEQVLERVQKPARYIGGELGSVVKNLSEVDVRYALCFPDLYEIGMSHLGSKILYSLTNAQEGVWCERVFTPAADMEAEMRAHNIPLYALESLDSLAEFDIIGFTLQFELCYTTVLHMLDMAGIPIRSADREGLSQIVMAGGPCACNPEPMADFFDLFALGEGEELNLDIIALYRRAKSEGWDKPRFLRKAAKIKGVYVPSLYDITYNGDGTIAAITPTGDAPARPQKRIVEDISSMFFPEKFIVPYIDVVHDRSMLEVLRGCIRGCRFCQAGFIYRPFREKSYECLNEQAKSLTKNTGYEEISLTSLSTSDYSQLPQLLDTMLPWTNAQNVNLSLPSLRIDSFSPEVLEQVSAVRKSGLTFAPEAGTQRMRDVINKNITEDEVMRTCQMAFEGGYTSVKLYFMLGLPTETDEDVAGIAELAQKVVDLFYSLPNKPKGKGVNVSISAACFVPKPFTPFEFEPQDSMEVFAQKQMLLKNSIRTKKISYRYHDSPTSTLEAVLARGDRRLCAVVEAAWRKGSTLDGWSEFFSMQRWEEAMTEAGLTFEFYARRRREYDEIMPWSHLDYGVSREFLIRESKRAHEDKTTPNCREGCTACGASKLYSGEVLAPCRC